MAKKINKASDGFNEILLYTTPNGSVKVEDVRTINEHLKNIFKTGELFEDSVIRNFRTTAADY